jgi:hypothetical protein
MGISLAKRRQTVTVSNFHRASPRFSGYCRLLRLVFGRFPGKRPLCNAQMVQSAAKAPFLQLQDQQLSAETLNFTGARPFFRQNATFASRERGRVGQKRAVADDIDGAFRRASAKTCSFAGILQKRHPIRGAKYGQSAPAAARCKEKAARR